MEVEIFLVVDLTHSLFGGSKLMKIVVFSVLNVTYVISTWKNSGSQVTYIQSLIPKVS